jgi:Tol biopolymer transport system component
VSDVFVHDRQTGATTRVSVATGGAAGNSNSLNPSVSDDGRFVVFGSAATNLVTGDTNNKRDIFVHDRQTGTTRRVSAGAAQANNDSVSPAISGDGRVISFSSTATNLVTGDSNTVADVFVVGNPLP